MSQATVAIMMGSQSDVPVLEEAAKILKNFGIVYDMRVLSAHRTPKETCAFAEDLRGRGIKVVICGAGVSAALAGVVAAHTTIPVLGVPIDVAPLNGMDALLSTVQMPPGVPVGCLAVGKAGAKNAALLAIRIMSLSDESLAKKLDDFREAERKKILAIKLDS